MLRPSESQDFIKSLYNAFGKNSPSDQVLEFLYSKICHIPTECLTWIEERFLSVNEKFPTKVHLAILGCWYDWRRAHPDKTDYREQRSCRNANCIDGVLYLTKKVDLYREPAEFVVNCGDCNRITNEPNVPKMTMFEASQQGYEAKDFEAKPIKDPVGLFGDVVTNWGAMARKVRKENAHKGLE